MVAILTSRDDIPVPTADQPNRLLAAYRDHRGYMVRPLPLGAFVTFCEQTSPGFYTPDEIRHARRVDHLAGLAAAGMLFAA